MYLACAEKEAAAHGGLVDVAEPLDRRKAKLGTCSFAIAIPGANISTNGPPGRSCTWCGNGAANCRTPARRPIAVNRAQSSTTASARFNPDVRLHFPSRSTSPRLRSMRSPAQADA